jgi:CheY-like chemotaxis protein
MARILVVDDSPGQVSRTVAILRGAGHQVLGAADWSECRTMLRQFVPDLVLMDVHLAGMQGGDILALQLKKNPTLRHVIVIFHSASKEADLRVMVIRSGADGYIVKGLSPEALLADVTRFLATHGIEGT